MDFLEKDDSALAKFILNEFKVFSILRPLLNEFNNENLIKNMELLFEKYRFFKHDYRNAGGIGAESAKQLQSSFYEYQKTLSSDDEERHITGKLIQTLDLFLKELTPDELIEVANAGDSVLFPCGYSEHVFYGILSKEENGNYKIEINDRGKFFDIFKSESDLCAYPKFIYCTREQANNLLLEFAKIRKNDRSSDGVEKLINIFKDFSCDGEVYVNEAIKTKSFENGRCYFENMEEAMARYYHQLCLSKSIPPELARIRWKKASLFRHQYRLDQVEGLETFKDEIPRIQELCGEVIQGKQRKLDELIAKWDEKQARENKDKCLSKKDGEIDELSSNGAGSDQNSESGIDVVDSPLQLVEPAAIPNGKSSFLDTIKPEIEDESADLQNQQVPAPGAAEIRLEVQDGTDVGAGSADPQNPQAPIPSATEIFLKKIKDAICEDQPLIGITKGAQKKPPKSDLSYSESTLINSVKKGLLNILTENPDTKLHLEVLLRLGKNLMNNPNEYYNLSPWQKHMFFNDALPRAASIDLKACKMALVTTMQKLFADWQRDPVKDESKTNQLLELLHTAMNSELVNYHRGFLFGKTTTWKELNILFQPVENHRRTVCAELPHTAPIDEDLHPTHSIFRH